MKAPSTGELLVQQTREATLLKVIQVAQGCETVTQLIEKVNELLNNSK